MHRARVSRAAAGKLEREATDRKMPPNRYFTRIQNQNSFLSQKIHTFNVGLLILRKKQFQKYKLNIRVKSITIIKRNNDIHNS